MSIEKEITDTLINKGCKPIFVPNIKSTKIKYECKCGKIIEKLYKDFIRRGCRYCNSANLRKIPSYDNKPKDTPNEKWASVEGGWISSLGRAINSLGKELTLCTQKFRYRINGKHQYVSRLVAEAFQINNYEKLSDPKYVVSHIDKNPANNSINNLEIIGKATIGSYNGRKSRQTTIFAQKVNWSTNKFFDLEWKIVPELPKHKIYSNGEIWNGDRFLSFSKSEGYFAFYTNEKTYKVHRLVCYAFHPLKDRYSYTDYSGLQVNHRNGNKSDNSAINLEWCSASENMLHAYSAGLNKNSKPVVQLDKNTLEFIAKFPSIATASKQTNEPEHRISLSMKGKETPLLFKWCKADDKYYYIKEGDKIIGRPFVPVDIIIEE